MSDCRYYNVTTPGRGPRPEAPEGGRPDAHALHAHARAVRVPCVPCVPARVEALRSELGVPVMPGVPGSQSRCSMQHAAAVHTMPCNAVTTTAWRAGGQAAPRPRGPEAQRPGRRRPGAESLCDICDDVHVCGSHAREREERFHDAFARSLVCSYVLSETLSGLAGCVYEFDTRRDDMRMRTRRRVQLFTVVNDDRPGTRGAWPVGAWSRRWLCYCSSACSMLHAPLYAHDMTCGLGIGRSAVRARSTTPSPASDCWSPVAGHWSLV